MTIVYFVRHALPNFDNHDDLSRELTAQGLKDRRLVTDFLWDKEIDVILSSPYKRAIDTVKEFADAKRMEIKCIEDFRERKVGESWIQDFSQQAGLQSVTSFEDFSKKQWEDFDFKLPGGESLKEVQSRNINALHQVLETYPNKNVVIGSHGTALSTMIHYYEPSFGYKGFEGMKNLMPWIAVFFFEGIKCLRIEKYNLFS